MPVPNSSDRVVNLVENVLKVSHDINPDYTHTQHMAWALGILADVVLQKNHMDTIVFARLHERLNQLTKTSNYPTNPRRF